jgi:hypothetical protein
MSKTIIFYVGSKLNKEWTDREIRMDGLVQPIQAVNLFLEPGASRILVVAGFIKTR